MSKKSEKSTEIRTFILNQIEKHPTDITSLAAETFEISKQAIRKHLQVLIKDGAIKVTGETRARNYQLNLLDNFKITIPLEEGISEDGIWRQNIRPRLENISSNVIGICQFGLTEMVNNVIDHSEGSKLTIQLRRTAAYVELLISDNGIGIFNKIASALGLEDKIHVILELSKGKLTTDPKRHTGEGIFFTSRIFDRFMMISGNLVFAHTEANNDWLLEENDDLHQGTLVILKIALASNRKVQDVFNQFASGEDFDFSKTHIPVTLARYGDENLISRSQAKRLLVRFEKFREIVLDFSNVETIGQAFADEIFRVYQNNHPAIHITYLFANEQVEKMILRAISAS